MLTGPQRYILPAQLETDPNRLFDATDIVQIVNVRPAPDTLEGCSYTVDTEDDKVGVRDVLQRVSRYRWTLEQY